MTPTRSICRQCWKTCPVKSKKGTALRLSGKSRARIHRMHESWNLVWIRGSRHWNPKKAVDEVSRSAPFFFTKQIPDEAVPQHMKDYMARTRRTWGDGKKLVGGCQRKSSCCMRRYCAGMLLMAQSLQPCIARSTIRPRRSSPNSWSR